MNEAAANAYAPAQSSAVLQNLTDRRTTFCRTRTTDDGRVESIPSPKTANQQLAADVDKSGKANASDALMILQYAANLLDHDTWKYKN